MITVIEFIISFWIAIIISLFLSSIYFLNLKRKTNEDIDRRRFMTLIFVMFLFLAISRLFHLISLLRHGSLEGVGVVGFSIENELIFTMSQIFFYLALITLVASFEKRIKHSKNFYYTIILSGLVAIYFVFRHIYIFDKENETLYFIDLLTSYMLNICVGIFSLYLSLMYLKISFKVAGSIRRKAFSIFIGFILLAGSYTAFILEDFAINPEIIAIISSSLLISSIPFLIYGYK